MSDRATRRPTSGPRRANAIAAAVQPLEDRRLMSAVPHPTFVIRHPTLPGVAAPLASDGSPDVFTPKLLRKAYGMDAVKFGTVTGDGTGQTIAIVDAYDDPTIAADLKTFDKAYGLSDPPSFKVVSQTGSTTNLPDTDPAGAGSENGTWETETALDVEWAHAVAPKANLVLVEADDDTTLFDAVAYARTAPNVTVVSMSWGGDEYKTDAGYYDKLFTTPSGHANVTFVASAGDSGAYSAYDPDTKAVSYPAASVNVLSVGGTSLYTKSDGTYVGEDGWGYDTDSGYYGGGGGGISKYAKQPAYQTGVVTQSKTYRTVPDVALDADSYTGVDIIDSYDNGDNTPMELGGTSLAAPLWAGVIAVADQGRVIANLKPLDGPTQTLPYLYKLASTNFHDVTTGSNGFSAAKGYDLVTGLGTPIVNKLAVALAAVGATPTATPVTGTLLAWNLNGQAKYGTQSLAPKSTATGVTSSTKLTRGSGIKTSVGTAASNAWGGTNWSSTSSGGISGSKFVSFGLTVGAGRTTSLKAVDLYYRRDAAGPANGYWQYQLNGGTWTKFADVSKEFSSTSTGGAAMAELSLTGVAALQSLPAGTVVNLRLTPYGATSSSAAWYLYDGGKNRTDLSITAAAAAAKAAVVTAGSTDDPRKHRHPFAG